MSKLFRFFQLAVVVSLVSASSPVFATADSGSKDPSAHAAGSCNINRVGRRLGPTYVTSLSVSRVSCNEGIALVKAYYRCRVASGGKKGHCRRPVNGYRCSERRAGIPTQFSARVSCGKGRAKVQHTYTEFT